MENKTNWILVTGGLGFIGSHTSFLLMNQSWNLVIFDNLSNSNIQMVDKLNKLNQSTFNDFGSTNNLTKLNKGSFVFEEGDIRDQYRLNKLFIKYQFYAVIHFAALKSVGESNKYQDLYYDVNVNGTKNILNMMRKFGCDKFIYSSSATVYGDQPAPVCEIDRTGNNLSCWYAQNKYDVENLLINNYTDIDICILRYFNPIGAHPSGLIGEDPKGIPNNIFPYLLRVALHANTPFNISHDPSFPYFNYDKFTVFGGDYPTPDGTCIRDYVHVMDLARAHIEVLNSMNMKQNLKIYNVGTGSGTSVLEMVNKMNEILKKNNFKSIPFVIGKRRDGDLVKSYANVDLIYREIGFKTSLNVDDMIIDGLNFIGLSCKKQ